MDRIRTSIVRGNQIGMQVRHKDGRIGAIVPDFFSLCGGSEGMVNWDGSRDSEAVNLEDLRELKTIISKADAIRCNGCVFGYFDSRRKYRCCRYDAARRWVALYGGGNGHVGNRLPDRIYPNCQSGAASP